MGSTGVKDELQPGVPETIFAIRQAGLRIWVLTGDKMETAVNIAYSSGILDQHSKLLEILCEKDLTYDDYNSVIIEGDVLASL